MNRQFALAAAAVLTVEATAAPLSLPDAQKRMLAANDTLAVSALELDRARVSVREAKAGWYPLLDVVGSYSYLTEKNRMTTAPSVMTVSVPGMPAPVTVPNPGGTRTLGDNDKIEVGADLSFPVTQAIVNRHYVLQRSYAVEAKEFQNSGLRNQLSLKLGSLYLYWRLSYRAAEVNQTLVRQLEENLRQVTAIRAAGAASGTRVLEAQARLESARVDQLDAQNRCDSLKAEVLLLVQETDTSIFPEAFDLTGDPQTWKELDTITVNPCRPELQALRLNQSFWLETERMQLGQKYPGLAAVVGFRYANPGLNMGADDFMGYGLLGAQLRWNLFDGMKVRSQRQQSRRQVDILRKTEELTIETFRKNLQTAVGSVRKADAQLKAAQAAQRANDALAADLKNSLAAGVVTQADYLDQLTKQARAALAVEQARFAMNNALLQAYFWAGRDLRF